LKSSHALTADYFSNALLVNQGNGTFETVEMPLGAQFSSYRDAMPVHANNDGLIDILLFGNYYDNNIQMGRYDADFGTILVNQGNGKFLAQQLNGIQVKGQVRRIKKIIINNKEAFILAKNNDRLQVITWR
jgi:enediyne biosynthesis protein E4